MIRQCPTCNVEYDADPKRLKHGRQTTCSRKCSYIYRCLNRQYCVRQYKMEICACGQQFIVDRKGRKYCSRLCSHKYKQYTRVIKKPHNYECLYCKKNFISFHRRNKKRIFCSRKCYEKQKSNDMSGNKNPMYGKSPTVPKNYSKQHWVHVGGKNIFVRSSWEMAVAYYLERMKYKWEYEYKRYNLGNGITYVPDFFILSADDTIEKIIEVKGWVRPKDRKKLKLFRKSYSIPVEVWKEKELKKLNLLDGQKYGKIT